MNSRSGPQPARARVAALFFALTTVSLLAFALAGGPGCNRKPKADAAVEPAAPKTVRPTEVMADERESFVVRCSKLCIGNGFQTGKVKEIEVVSESVRRECYCVSGGREAKKPIMSEEMER